MLGLHRCTGFSLAEASRGYSPVVVHGLLFTAACCKARARGHVGSVVSAPGRQGARAGARESRPPGRQNAGSAVVEHRFSCPEACGISPDQGSNLFLLHWQTDSLPLSHQEAPTLAFPSCGNALIRVCSLTPPQPANVLGMTRHISILKLRRTSARGCVTASGS